MAFDTHFDHSSDTAIAKKNESVLSALDALRKEANDLSFEFQALTERPVSQLDPLFDSI